MATTISLPEALTPAPDGNLYGMSLFGGFLGGGVLFQFNPVTSTFTKMLDIISAGAKIQAEH